MIIINGGYAIEDVDCEDCPLPNSKRPSLRSRRALLPIRPPRDSRWTTAQRYGNVIGFEHEEQKLMLGMTFRTDLILLRIEFPDTFATRSIRPERGT